MNKHERIVQFMGVAWDVEYLSDPDEVLIVSITVNGGEELINEFTENFKDELHTELLVQLERRAAELRTERQLNKRMMYK